MSKPSASPEPQPERANAFLAAGFVKTETSARGLSSALLPARPEAAARSSLEEWLGATLRPPARTGGGPKHLRHLLEDALATAGLAKEVLESSFEAARPTAARSAALSTSAQRSRLSTSPGGPASVLPALSGDLQERTRSVARSCELAERALGEHRVGRVEAAAGAPSAQLRAERGLGDLERELDVMRRELVALGGVADRLVSESTREASRQSAEAAAQLQITTSPPDAAGIASGLRHLQRLDGVLQRALVALEEAASPVERTRDQQRPAQQDRKLPGSSSSSSSAAEV